MAKGASVNMFEDNPFLVSDQKPLVNPATTDSATVNKAAGVTKAVAPTSATPGLPKGLNSLFSGDTHRQKFSGADAAQISSLLPQLKKMGFGAQVTRSGHVIVHAAKSSGPSKSVLSAQHKAIIGSSGKGSGKSSSLF